MRENYVYKTSPRLISLTLVESCKKSRHPLSIIELKSKRECAQTYWNTWNVHTNCFDIAVYKHLLGRSLMIGWRKNSWNPEKVPSVVTFVCVCVCLSVRPRATGYTFWTRNLIFVLNDPWAWDMRKKRIFFVFRNFHFYAFYRHFSIFSLYSTSKFFVSSYQSVFHLGMWCLGWENLVQ